MPFEAPAIPGAHGQPPLTGGPDTDPAWASAPDSLGKGGAENTTVTVRDTSARIIALDTRFGARDVVGSAVGAAALARRALAAGFADHRGVLAAASEAHQVAGWVAFDSEHQDLSRRMSVTALRLARAAGDRSMEYFVLSQLAMQNVHLRRPAEAARICDTALSDGVRGSVAALFTLRAARAAAQSGEHARARLLIRHTRGRHLDGTRPEDPAWAWWLTGAEIDWHHAMIRTDAGDWGQAAELFHAACQGAPDRGRSIAVYRASLLCALARAHSWDEAETVLVRDVLPRRGEVASVRTRRILDHAARLLDGARRRPSLREAARRL
ncbi:DNA-binding protein [Nocardiopsis terrae]